VFPVLNVLYVPEVASAEGTGGTWLDVRTSYLPPGFQWDQGNSEKHLNSSASCCFPGNFCLDRQNKVVPPEQVQWPWLPQLHQTPNLTPTTLTSPQPPAPLAERKVLPAESIDDQLAILLSSRPLPSATFAESLIRPAFRVGPVNARYVVEAEPGGAGISPHSHRAQLRPSSPPGACSRASPKRWFGVRGAVTLSLDGVTASATCIQFRAWTDTEFKLDLETVRPDHHANIKKETQFALRARTQSSRLSHPLFSYHWVCFVFDS
jgi:hypothetical protein